MRSHRSTVVLAGIALLACSLAFASPAGAQTAARKFGRGLAGMTTGFLEFPGNTYAETEKRGAVGVPIGMAKGLGMIVSRELVGVYEVVSAPFPAPAGFRRTATSLCRPRMWTIWYRRSSCSSGRRRRRHSYRRHPRRPACSA